MKKTSIIVVVLAFTLANVSCKKYPQGQLLYATYCSNCHQPDGSGLGAMVPNLSGSNVLRDESSYVACIIRYGSDPNSAIAEYFTPMPSFKNLSSTEISNIMNFMNNSWGNKLPMITPYDVEDALQDCPEY